MKARARRPVRHPRRDVPTSARPEKPKPGTCRVCGCTDNHACAFGCWWVDNTHTLCSECTPEKSERKTA